MENWHRHSPVLRAWGSPAASFINSIKRVTTFLAQMNTKKENYISFGQIYWHFCWTHLPLTELNSCGIKRLHCQHKKKWTFLFNKKTLSVDMMILADYNSLIYKCILYYHTILLASTTYITYSTFCCAYWVVCFPLLFNDWYSRNLHT